MGEALERKTETARKEMRYRKKLFAKGNLSRVES